MKFETCISTHKGDGLASVTFTSENREQAEEAADAMNIWSFHRIPEDGREVTESRWKSIGFGWTEGGGSGGPDIDPERFQQLPPDDGYRHEKRGRTAPSISPGRSKDLQYSIETAAGFAHASGDRRTAEKRADGLAGTSIEESRTSSTLVNGIPQRMKPIARAYKDGKGIWQWAERLPEEDTVPELDKIAGSR